MPIEVFFKNTQTGKEYKVISMDKTAGTITLQSEYSTFTEPYDKDKFKRLGYELVKREVEVAK